jgi:hypothetical protein
MTIAAAAHTGVGSYAPPGQGSAGCLPGLPHCQAEVSRRTTVAARTHAIAWEAETVPFEMAPHWRPSEDEIMRAAITVILVALLTIMALAAAAILTMG